MCIVYIVPDLRIFPGLVRWLLEQNYAQDKVRQILDKAKDIGQTLGTLHSAVSFLVCIVPSNSFFLFFFPYDKYLKWRWCNHFYHILIVLCSVLGGYLFYSIPLVSKY